MEEEILEVEAVMEYAVVIGDHLTTGHQNGLHNNGPNGTMTTLTLLMTSCTMDFVTHPLDCIMILIPDSAKWAWFRYTLWMDPVDGFGSGSGSGFLGRLLSA